MFRLRPLCPLVLLLALAAPRPAAAQGLDTVGMDRSVPPGESFFDYANGGWIARTEIPADRSSYGASAILVDQTDAQVADLIRQAAASDARAGSERRKVGDYYAAFMDSTAIEARGLAPLKPTLDSIAGLRDRAQLARFLGTTLRADVDAINATDLTTGNILGLWVAQDMDDPSRYSPFLLQGGLGMPDREYYIDTSAAMADIRRQYQEHVAAMLGLAGVADADVKAVAIVRLETRIAETHASREESGDVRKGNNHWARAEFDRKAPGLDWRSFFAAAGLQRADRFVVWQPGAVSGIARLAGAEPLDVWKDYLAFHAIEGRAAVLPARVVAQAFAFGGPVLSGAREQRARWKRAVDATNEALGFAVGKLYVERFFPPAEKKRAQEMVANLIAAFGERIDRLEWMAPATKREARAKLAVLKVGVGYPDVWPGYDGLEVVASDAYGNAERAGLFRYRRRLALLGRPVDRGE